MFRVTVMSAVDGSWPNHAFGRADDAEARHRAISGRASDRQNDVPWLDLGLRQRGGNECIRLDLEQGEIAAGIPAGQRGGKGRAIRQGDSDFVVPLDHVVGGNDQPRCPDDAAGRKAPAGVNRDGRGSRALDGGGDVVIEGRQGVRCVGAHTMSLLSIVGAS